MNGKARQVTERGESNMKQVQHRAVWVVGSIAVVLLLAMVLVTCGHPAQATTLGGKSFTAQATPASDDGRALSGCWTWEGRWRWVNLAGNTAYKFGVEVLWCARYGRITSLDTHLCKNFGGFFHYEGCTKDRGGLGYASLSVFDTWRYTFGCCGFETTRTPAVDFKLYPDGRVSGWVYYDL
jgi:hypothetical protein